MREQGAATVTSGETQDDYYAVSSVPLTPFPTVARGFPRRLAAACRRRRLCC